MTPPDTPTNDNNTASLRDGIATLANEILAARGEVAAGNDIELGSFMTKVSAFCAAISANPPSDADAPMIMTSIEGLVNDLNDLGRELAELQASRDAAKDNT